MQEPSPQLIQELKALQKMLASFVVTYKEVDSKVAKKKYITKAKECISVLKIIIPIIKEAEEEVTPKCPPSDIPVSVTKHDKAKGIEILNSKVKDIKKYKEDYESYLLNCFGIQLNWKNGLPSPNVGGKFSFDILKNRLIIFTRKMEKDPNIGQAQISAKLRRYRELEGIIRNSLVEENVNSSLTEDIDLEHLKKLEELLKENPGGLNDIYDNIIKDPDLKQQYKKTIDRIQDDWKEDGRMNLLKEKVEERLKQTTEREQDSPCSDEEPEAKDEHEALLEQKDLSKLPLYNQGLGDESAIDMNDIDQGGAGDCYYLSSAAALAKTHPELFEGENSIIQKNGENYEVTLHLRESRTSKKRTPTIITVSPNVLVDKDGKPKYQGLGDNELWAIVLEKAYAQVLGGYDNIEGGTTNEALGVLTGRETISLDPNSLSNEDLLKKIEESIDCQYPTTFSSTGTGEKEEEISFGGKTQKLFQGHAYTLEKVEGNTIFLYNPHGERHLELDVNLVKKHFRQIQILEL